VLILNPKQVIRDFLSKSYIFLLKYTRFYKKKQLNKTNEFVYVMFNLLLQNELNNVLLVTRLCYATVGQAGCFVHRPRVAVASAEAQALA